MQRRKNKRRKTRKPRTYSSMPAKELTTEQPLLFGFIKPRAEVTLKYSTVVTFTTVLTLTGASREFISNACFAPDAGAGGHQPYGYDQMSNIYSRYRVIKLRWNVQFTPSSDRMIVGVINSSQSITPVTNLATLQLASESPRSFSRALSFSGGPPAIFKGSVAINSLIGLTPAQLLADDVYSANVSGNPGELTYFTLFCYNPSTTSVTFGAKVDLWFSAIMYDPYLQNQST